MYKSDRNDKISVQRRSALLLSEIERRERIMTEWKHNYIKKDAVTLRNFFRHLKMNAKVPLELRDYVIILVLLPVFFLRFIHWGFDRYLCKDKNASKMVDSYANRFSADLTSVDIRPGRCITILHRSPEPINGSPRGLIIFVHGSCARMQQLVALMDGFFNRGYEIIAYDALGCGLSSKPVGEALYFTGEMYEDMTAVICKYTSERGKMATCVMGHSFGGAMVTKFAASSESSSLCMSAVSLCQPAGLTAHKKAMSIFKYPISVLWLIRPLLGLKARELLFGPKATEELRRQEREASARNPVHMFRSFYNGYDISFFSPDVVGTELHIPVLFLGAECDRVCPAADVKAVADRFKRSSHYRIVRECGHQCMQEDPAQVMDLVTNFLVR